MLRDRRGIWSKIVLAGCEGRLGDVAKARALSEEAEETEEVATRVCGESGRMTGWAREERDEWAAQSRNEETA